MDTIVEQQLRDLKLSGFLAALKEQHEMLPQYSDLPFELRLRFLLDREHIVRHNKRLTRLQKDATLKINASLEDLNYEIATRRGLKKEIILELAQGQWITHAANMIITGPTGVGKTFLGCALGNKLLRSDIPLRYQRCSDLTQSLLMAQADGSLCKVQKKLSSFKLLIIDEWLRDSCSDVHARLILDVLDDRYKNTSTLFISQFPVADWYKKFSDPTLAEALLDRIVHNAHRIEISGESMRKGNTINSNYASLRSDS